MFQDSTSAIMAISTLFIFLISSILLIVIPFNTAQMSFGADNFTANNTFSQNCRQILSSLASNVSANGGFYFNTLGKDNATVYALGLCRGDFPTDRCFNCIDTSSRNIIENCASKTEDVDWGDPDRCTVRYSDKSFFRGMSDYPKICVYNTNNISNDVVDEFQRAIDDLVDRLVIKASKGFSKLKFATGKTNFTVYDDNIYGLMQCTPDLSSADCDKCLRGAVQYYRKCSRRATANNILSPSCIFEYDLRPFYESTAYDISLAPPPAVASAPVPPPHQTPPPPGKGEKNSTNTLRIAIIVVVVLTSICLILITLACGFFYMWKKESAVNRRGRRSGSPETMAWLRAATKLFSQSRQGSVNHAGFKLCNYGHFNFVHLPNLFTAQMSYGADNFTANSTFAQNCCQILSSLASNVSANGGFYVNTLGKDNATVYALGLCRGDFPTDRCFNCINTSSRTIIQNCANKTEDVGWGDPDRCTVRYSNKSIFRGMSDQPERSVYNTNNIADDVVDEFKRAIDDLIGRLVIKASKGFSKLKFATGKTNFTVYDDNIYGLMQCTPDLSSADCERYLRGVVEYYRESSRRAIADTILVLHFAYSSCLSLW
ncbi:cysteine-rich receptor-like protein kinase 22 isoform X5 [Diospyros lotus]|uniref:cysteine-rich receptor-like protein kinase 22 isoform X5 n=1 Tax=Diospyros lotus TaxID=55363 RepID=UPI0022523A1E|nr:cysteine-rich receptor-like protein kinase 22 isoform X5 [Diospyros lotus]